MAFKKPSSDKPDIYETVTNKILEKLEQGHVPWQKPWDIKTGAPCNLITGKPYNGINIMLLGSQGQDSKFWMTYKQCADKGGNVKKGEKGSTVVFWNFLDKKTGKSVDSDSEQVSTSADKIPMLRYYTVFNANQCEGLDVKRLQQELDEKDLGREHEDITPAQDIIDSYVDKPEIKHGFTRACYRPASDEVNMPQPEAFKTSEEYYSTLFHELVHSTGHENRLARRGSAEIREFGDEDYSKEELVAEMGASFLCARAGIENVTIDNSAAYIQSWMKALKDDKKMLITAAGQAQKASIYIAEGLGAAKTAEVELSAPVEEPIINTTAQDIQKAVDDGRIPQELVESLKGPNFEYTDDELMPVILSIAENPNSELLAQCIVTGTISSREILESMIGAPKTAVSTKVRI